MFISLLKEDENRTYRRAISKVVTLLDRLNLPIPSYSTLHKSQIKFDKDELGVKVFNEATILLLSMGVKEALDPIRIIRTNVTPQYEAPKILLTSQKDVDRQNAMDDEAQKLNEFMHASVMKWATEAKTPLSCAIDGSGESISGPGLYFEHIWKINNRRFIKQHTMIDLRTLRVVSFAITMEKPGDARMFVPLLKGALLVGVRVSWVSADSAYDTKENWTFMDKEGIAFCPNLKENYKGDWELKRRDALSSFDKMFGKKLAHRITGYNSRWLVESFFSVFKKLYGQDVRNRLFPMMVISMEYRYTLYDIHREFMTEAMNASEV